MDLQVLRQHLDEDERVALAALDAEVYITLTITGQVPVAAGDSGARALVEHHHRHDPARVLRWVAAARTVLELHALDEQSWRCVHCVEQCGCIDAADLTTDAIGAAWMDCTHGNVSWPCPTVEAIAGVYGEVGDG